MGSWLQPSIFALVDALEDRTLLSASPTILQFNTSAPNAAQPGITEGPDGNIWFTEFNNNAVGRITPSGVMTLFPVSPGAASQPSYITTGADGNLWFTQVVANEIGVITPSGTVNEFSIPGGPASDSPNGVTEGQDGNIWFTESTGNKIGRITPSGALSQFSVPTALSFPAAIAAGPDGNLWFTEDPDEGNGQIGRITTSGVITEFPLPATGAQRFNIYEPFSITAGPDGNVWFTETGVDAVGRITPSGTITEFPLPAAVGEPLGITAGPDGNLWFTEASGNQIGSISPSGVITQLALPAADSGAASITVGPDGNLWFTDTNGLGELALPATQLGFSQQPTDTVGGGAITPAVTVDVEDQLGDTLTANDSNVTLSLASGPAGATLGGTLTEQAVDGVATFNDLSVNMLGTYTLTATDGTLTGATSSSFNVTPAQLEFISQPSNGGVGTTITPSVTVDVDEEFGDLIFPLRANDSDVTLSIASGPAGAVLSGTLTEQAVDGVATFDNLSVNLPGTYTLLATDGDLAGSATSNTFRIVTGFTTVIDVPGSISTFPASISGNNVVGNYYDTSGGSSQGFLYNDSTSTYTAIDVSGSADTYPNSVSGSSVVGSYLDSSGGNYQGFLYNASTSTYTVIDVPGSTSTQPGSVSGSDVVGDYYGGGNEQGFMYNTSTSTYTVIDVPGSARTYLVSVSGSNDVGFSQGSDGNVQGFLYNASTSTYTVIDVPGSTWTIPTSVSGSNVAGYYLDSSGLQQGFLYNASTSTFTLINAPASTATSATSISGSNVVGYYGDGSGDEYGFLYDASTSTYTVINVPGSTEAEASSISGTSIVGGYVGSGDAYGFLYQVGPATQLAFSQQPSDIAVGSAIAPAVTVDVENLFGDTFTTDSSNVTLSIGSGPAGATLGGTLTEKAVDGVATFSDLSLSVPGTYTLIATDGTLATATSASVVIDGPPPITAPTNISVNFNGALAFTGNSAINVTDPSGTAEQLTLSVSDGTLSFATTSGLASITGNGTGSLVATGPLSALNADLASLSYTPTSGYSGPDTLSLSDTDTADSFTGTASVSITVTALATPIAVAKDGGGFFSGNSFPATATATGVGGAAVNGTFSFTYYLGSSVSGLGSSTAPTSAGTYTVVAVFASGDPSYSNAQSAPLAFTISQATPTVAISDAGGTYNGSPFPAMATVAGVVTGVDNTPSSTLEGVGLTVTYYTGIGMTGTQSSVAPTDPGVYTVVASFPGSADYTSASASTSFGIRTLLAGPFDGHYVGTAVGNLQADDNGDQSSLPVNDQLIAVIANNNITMSDVNLLYPATGSIDSQGNLSAEKAVGLLPFGVGGIQVIYSGAAVATNSIVSISGTWRYTFEDSRTHTTANGSGTFTLQEDLGQLVVTTQPPTSGVVETPFDVTVTDEYANGTTVTDFDGPVTIALANNPGNGTLGGTLTVDAVNGVADFPDLTLDESGTGYTLQASSGNLQPVATDPFDVVEQAAPTAPANLAVTPATAVSENEWITDEKDLALSGTVAGTGLSIDLFDTTTNTDLGLATVNGTSFTISLDLPEGLHDLRVRAENSGGYADAFVNTLVDLTPPTSTVDALPVRETSESFTVSVTASDPSGAGGAPASGIASVAVYDSVNGGAFNATPYIVLPASQTSFTFAGSPNTTYGFYSVATDIAGNVQNKSPVIEASTYVPDLTPPVTQVTSVNSSTPSFNVNWSGTDAGGSGVADFEVFVSVDGGAATEIGEYAGGSPNSSGVYSGSSTYQAIADGHSHTYGFYSIGINGAGAVQATPTSPQVTVTTTFAAPPALSATGLTLNNNSQLTERSYIRYLDVTFNETTGLSNVANLSNNELSLQWLGITGIASAVAVPLSGTKITVNGQVLTIDFGSGGLTSALGGSPSTNAYDGYYGLTVSPSGGTPNTFYFFRLLGSVTGDSAVSTADLSAITAAMGQKAASGTILNADVNGDGSVTSLDRTLAAKAQSSGDHVVTPASFSLDAIEVAGGRVSPANAVEPLTQAELAPVFAAAIHQWQQAGLDSQDLSFLRRLKLELGYLPGSYVGLYGAGVIYVDETAQGHGWFVDVAGSPTAGREDLLTVIEHEMGDALGLKDLSGATIDPNELMDEVLPAGQRRSPTAADVAQVLSAKTSLSAQSVLADPAFIQSNSDKSLLNALFENGALPTGPWATSFVSNEQFFGNAFLPATTNSGLLEVEKDTLAASGAGSGHNPPDTIGLDELFAGLAQSEGNWLLN